MYETMAVWETDASLAALAGVAEDFAAESGLRSCFVQIASALAIRKWREIATGAIVGVLFVTPSMIGGVVEDRGSNIVLRAGGGYADRDAGRARRRRPQ